MADDQRAKYATVDDVAVDMQQTIDPGSPHGRQVQYWLDKAERKIHSRVPMLDQWAGEDAFYKATVKDVLVSAVERKALNPEGLRSVMTQVDDANIQQTIDSTRSVGEISILDEEWAQLLRIDSGSMNSVQACMDPCFVPLPSYPYCY